jgi:CTP:molybdopterin cytidylyltransferase MocA
MIAGIVLDAGGSTRMGRPKMLLPAGSGTLLSVAVAPLLEAGLDRVVVVLGDRAEEVCRRARLPLLVSRADVADLMLRALERPETIGQVIGIAN